MIFKRSDHLNLREVESALLASEERYRQLFDNIYTSVVIYQPIDDGDDFVFKDVNRAVEKSEKLKKKDLIGKKVTEVFPAVKKFGLFEVLQRVYRTGKPEFFPISLYHDERITGWRENYVYKLSTGEVVAVYNDLTEKMQYLHDLKKSEEQFRLLFENTLTGILAADPVTKKFLFVNPAFLKLTGYTEKEVLDLDVYHLHPKKDLKFVLEVFEKQAKGEMKEALKIPVLCKDKSVKLCRIYSNRMLINNRDCLVGFFWDVTEEVKAQVAVIHRYELEKLIVDISQKFAMLDSSKTSQGISYALDAVG